MDSRPPDGPVPEPPVLRHTWSQSQRFVARAFVQPAQQFMRLETAGGIAMLVAAVVAVVWANSPWREAYHHLWGTEAGLKIGGIIDLDLTLEEWVNDGLMTLFFFLVGLEIKRELVHGYLRDLKTASLPIIAALGGMIVPALIYVAFNAGQDSLRGWGIPMATDIAFAVGVVVLAGSRVPLGARIFLLTLAVADDIGAILVIAIFYSSGVQFGWLGAALLCLVAMLAMRQVDIRSTVPYVVVGVVMWYSMIESGVHPTLAGVAIALITPAWSFFSPTTFGRDARAMVGVIERSLNDGLTYDEYERNEAALGELVRLANETSAPLERLEFRLQPWVAFLIVPIFALANAGVTFIEDLENGLNLRVVLGVGLGLLVGKIVGVYGATRLGAAFGWGRLPGGVTWRHMLGLAATAGVGFTVALFVTGLAFVRPEFTDAAKIGILVFSTLAGIAGYLTLRSAGEPVPTGAGADGVTASPHP